jgi:histidinol-phosphatase (PHP family)
MLFDTHIHTKDFSPDARMSYADLITYADGHQPSLLCTTEHYDYDYPYPDHQLLCDIDLYHKTYMDAKKRYEEDSTKSFPLLFGIEYGYKENLAAYYDDLSKKYPFDNIICSIHYYENCDFYYEKDRYIYQDGKKAVYGHYLEMMIHSLEHCDGFDIVGHFDYITRYSPYADRKMYYRDFSDIFDTLFALCIQKGKALEFNTRVPVQLKSENHADYMFDPAILRRYRELGGELITLASDAHSMDYMQILFEETKVQMKAAGFHYLVYYKERKPNFVAI